MPDLSAPIDAYCERTDASFWSEPVNAISNAAFLLAALLACRIWLRTANRDFAALALILVTFAVGLGSFAFHTLATRGAALLDVIPIALFIYGYLFLALRRFLHLGRAAALAWVFVFAMASLALNAALPRGFLNGSGGYLPALAAMLVVGALARARPPGPLVLSAAGVFAISLMFRSIDHAVCAAFPLGTHFLWHGLNALVLYLLLRAAMGQMTAAAAARSSR